MIILKFFLFEFKLGVKLFLLFIEVVKLWFFKIEVNVWNIFVFICKVFLNVGVFIGMIMNFWKLILLLVCDLLLMMFIIGVGNIFVLNLFK